MRRTIVCGTKCGDRIIVANYDAIERYLDPLGARHMESLYDHCIPVGLSEKVVVDITHGEVGATYQRRLCMDSFGDQATRIMEGGKCYACKLNVGPSGMVFIGSTSHFIVERGNEVPLYDPAPMRAADAIHLGFKDGYDIFMSHEAFYQLDVTITDGRDW